MSLQKLEYDIPLVWDEAPVLDLDRYEIWRAPYLLIVGVDQGNKKFTIDRLLASWFGIGDGLTVTGSTGNDGAYTIVGVTETATQTVLEVSEAIPSAIADGYIGKSVIDQLADKTSKPSYTDKDMPVGFYYYVVYAVDKRENYSDPTDPLLKYSPTDVIPPTTPTGLIARRNSAFDAVDLKWNDIEDENLKGYIVSRTLNPRAGTPTWEVIALTSSSKYKDTEIPLDNDATLRQTEIAYYVQAYDKSGNVSASTAATYIFTIPLLQGIRTSLDFLSINVFWDLPLPEDGVEAVAIFYRQIGTAAWTFDGAVEGTKNFHRINGPLNVGRDYEVGLAVVTSDIRTVVRQGVGPPEQLYVAGDQSSLFTAADVIGIIHSAGNDGVQTLNSVLYIGGNDETRLEVSGALIDAEVLGVVNQTLGYFGMIGDLRANWTGDKIFIYVWGNNDLEGRYTVGSVTFDGIYTRLYVQETIPAGTPGGLITSGQIVNITTAGLQTNTQLVPFPQYETDTTNPTSPFNLLTKVDALQKRIYLNWTRVLVEDDFLEFYIDMTNTAADHAITAIDTNPDKFTVAGDQSAVFVTGDVIYAYGGTNNNGFWTITDVTVIAGPNTEITIDGELNDAVVDGSLMSERDWWNMDKTKNTNFQAFYNYVLSTTYRFRIRAVDRSGNKSGPTDCMATVLWDNTDLAGAAADPLMLPQWMDYTEQYLTSYKDANMRRYALTINDGPRISDFYSRYVLFLINRPWTPDAQDYFDLTKDEIISRPTFNTLTHETFQFPNLPITGVNVGAKEFTIAGNHQAWFKNGDIFRISGSTGNDGLHQVASSTYTGGNTVITTQFAIPDATVDGEIDMSIFIWPGLEDTFKSVWIGPNLPITAVNVGGKTFGVAGDVTGQFVAGYVFTIKRSTENDGFYTVVSSSFAAGTTTITVEEIIPNAIVDGSINSSILDIPAT
jgi:hypothetical protein